MVLRLGGVRARVVRMMRGDSCVVAQGNYDAMGSENHLELAVHVRFSMWEDKRNMGAQRPFYTSQQKATLLCLAQNQ
jgi:hypothetical protein